MLSNFIATFRLFSVCAVIAFSSSGGIALAKDLLRCDVPSSVVVQRVERTAVSIPNSGGKLMRLRIPFSLIAAPEYRGTIDSLTVEIVSPYQSLQVLDSWPKREVYTDVIGGIAVEETRQWTSNYIAKITAGIEPVVRANLGADHQDQNTIKEKFQRQPRSMTIASSGIANRGYGAFFKFMDGPNIDLQGTRELAILAEVPMAWRADLVQISVRAQGRPQRSFGSKTIFQKRMWITLHQEGDAAATAQAKNFWKQERTLRAMAASRAREVRQKSAPTVFHQLGVALDVMDPRIPEDYLEQVLFGPRNQYLEGNSHRLPIDLRIAILDFWDQRELLTDMAFGRETYLGPDRVPANPSLLSSSH